MVIYLQTVKLALESSSLDFKVIDLSITSCQDLRSNLSYTRNEINEFSKKISKIVVKKNNQGNGYKISN